MVHPSCGKQAHKIQTAEHQLLQARQNERHGVIDSWLAKPAVSAGRVFLLYRIHEYGGDREIIELIQLSYTGRAGNIDFRQVIPNDIESHKG